MNARFWLVAKPTERELRNFGLIMAAALALLATLAWYKDSQDLGVKLILVAVILSVVARTWKRALLPFYKIWMIIGGFLGFGNSHLLLALVFYLIFVPTGLIMRLFRGDPLERDFRKGSDSKESYWSRREKPLLPKEHYERQF